MERLSKPQIFPKRRPSIVFVIELAALEFGDDVGHEVFIRTRHMRGGHDEAVAAFTGKPFFHAVRDLLGRADKLRHFLQGSSGGMLNEIADRRVGFA